VQDPEFIPQYHQNKIKHGHNEETEAQRGKITNPRSSGIAEIRTQSNSRIHALHQIM
jgi:hypothetical protein